MILELIRPELIRETLSQSITLNIKELGQNKNIINRQGTTYALNKTKQKPKTNQTTAEKLPQTLSKGTWLQEKHLSCKNE